MAYINAAFPGALLAIEVDSYLHHSTLGDWSRDRSRNNELIALGWRVLSVTSHQLKVDPSAVVDQIARALGAAKVRSITLEERRKGCEPL